MTTGVISVRPSSRGAVSSIRSDAFGYGLTQAFPRDRQSVARSDT